MHMKITTDLAFLVTGAEDGSVFISKVQHFNDGMMTTDSEIISVIRAHNRDYTMLYSLERMSMCSTASECLREEKVIQLEADKADYDCDYAESISQKKQQIRDKIDSKEQEQKQLKNIDSQCYAACIQELQDKKKAVEKMIVELVRGTENEKSRSSVATDDKLRQLYQLNEKLVKEKEELVASNLRNIGFESDRLNGLFKQIRDEYSRESAEIQSKCKAA